MPNIQRLHLFQGYGVELEYMIVDKETLNVRPLAADLLTKAIGSLEDDFINGEITWSNELVMHVIELKSTLPVTDMVKFSTHFKNNILMANNILDELNAMLMPTAAHPWMNPQTDTVLWPYGSKEIYETYNKIFNCQGHGWSNLQSSHLNLPFYDDEEFARLHAAVRLVLPILPALAASSPVLEGKFSKFYDKRLSYYEKNQMRIPSITGKVIPEKLFSRRSYQKFIFDKIKTDLQKHDTLGIMDPVWVNSRGATARFDRGTIEIRLLDIQECPAADLAIIALVVHTLKWLVAEEGIKLHEQMEFGVEPLYKIFNATIRDAEETIINDPKFLSIFKIEKSELKAGELWKEIHSIVKGKYPDEMVPWENYLKNIFEQGTLARRIMNIAGNEPTLETLKLVYKELSDCLQENEMFNSWIEDVL
jgi:carboxylate-amine ligase